MTEKDIKEFFTTKPGYLKSGAEKIAELLEANVDDCRRIMKELKQSLSTQEEEPAKKEVEKKIFKNKKDVFADAFLNKEPEPVHKVNVRESKEGKNVLVIGDLHEPFCLDGYLQHCKETYDLYNCDEVVFIGDIIDNHASSYHETDPDGLSAGHELRLAIQNIKKWYEAFPKASVIIGNHDRLIMRKAYSSGLSRLWIKDFSEVLGTPNWNFIESIEIDGVLYIHGEGGTARSRARRDLLSVVQGHLHSQAYVEWIVGAKFKIFGMQVGCGINNKSYAMAYGKEFSKPAIGCGVILRGKTAINIMMDL
jgi:metallophosphoesterase superfamily enzyme